MSATTMTRLGGTTMYFGLIADEATTTGFLLAAIGEKNVVTGATNYYIVNEDTPLKKLKEFFMTLYARKNIGILLISADVAEKLRSILEKANKMLPIILKLPSKMSTIEGAHKI